MPVIRRADSDQFARAAVVVDLGDLQREARRIEQRALAQARAILDEARAERDRLIAGAADKGAARGHAEGLRRGLEEGRTQGREEALAAAKKEIEPLQKRWTEALNEFTASRDDLLASARADTLRFCCAFARRILSRAIELNPDSVAGVLEAALAQVLRPSRLVVECHPDDRAIIERTLPALVARYAAGTHAELRDNPALSRAGLVLRTESGVIDASIEAQIDRLVDALLPPLAPPQATSESAAP